MLIYPEFPQVKVKQCKQCLYMQNSEIVCISVLVDLGNAYFWKISDLKYWFELDNFLLSVNTGMKFFQERRTEIIKAFWIF